MKHLLTFLIFLTVSGLSFGQKIYQADREAYKSNKFSYEFYLKNDSVCYLKGNYHDNAIYFLYEGHLKKMNDTLYEFKFQPIVSFGCDKRFGSDDNIRIHLSQNDTTISSLTYNVKINTIVVPVQLKLGSETVCIKGADKQNFSIETKFIDPFTKESVYLTVNTFSEPALTYYGSKTAFKTIKISIINNKLTIYPDHKFVQDKDTFILKQ